MPNKRNSLLREVNMKVLTRDFGEVEVNEEDIFTFEKNILF
jgi:hypothetical protein